MSVLLVALSFASVFIVCDAFVTCSSFFDMIGANYFLVNEHSVLL